MKDKLLIAFFGFIFAFDSQSMTGEDQTRSAITIHNTDRCSSAFKKYIPEPKTPGSIDSIKVILQKTDSSSSSPSSETFPPHFSDEQSKLGSAPIKIDTTSPYSISSNPSEPDQQGYEDWGIEYSAYKTDDKHHYDKIPIFRSIPQPPLGKHEDKSMEYSDYKIDEIPICYPTPIRSSGKITIQE